MIYNVLMKKYLPTLIIVALPFLYFFLNIDYPVLGKDAADYNNYAVNIIQGSSYSRTIGGSFDNFREPGYPLFLAMVYLATGIENLPALMIVQTFLVALIGLLVYRLFARGGKESLGFVASVLIVLLPQYGLYTHIVGSELLFALMLAIFLSVTVHLCVRGGDSWLFVIYGLLAGCTTLVRLQFLFFLPVILVFGVLLVKERVSIKSAALSIVAFCIVLSSWVGFVYINTGSLSLTSGRRPQVVLHIRAERSKLSYSNNARYATDWVKRSLSGGQGSSFLEDNDYHYLQAQYDKVATTSQVISAIEESDKETIKSNFGRYLFGNFSEFIKLMYIEHDFSDSINKYIRATTYPVAYLLFAFGLYEVLRKKGKYFSTVAIVSLVFVIYNWLVITPFDAIPRYNTPYLFMYILIGFCGIALASEQPSSS